LPIYEYACRSCDHRFEELVKVNGSPVAVDCPECGSSETARLMSAFAVRSSNGTDRALAAAMSSAPAAGSGGCCGGACGCH
jgi:putative FmdB family regulatory protein